MDLKACSGKSRQTFSLTCIRDHFYACVYTRGLGTLTASQHLILSIKCNKHKGYCKIGQLCEQNENWPSWRCVSSPWTGRPGWGSCHACSASPASCPRAAPGSGWYASLASATPACPAWEWAPPHRHARWLRSGPPPSAAADSALHDLQPSINQSINDLFFTSVHTKVILDTHKKLQKICKPISTIIALSRYLRYQKRFRNSGDMNKNCRNSI